MNQPEQHLPNPLRDPRAWLTRILGSSVILLVLVVLALVGGGAIAGRAVYLKLEQLDRTQEILVTDLKVMNEQSVIREIVETKCPVLSPDQRARVAFEIYDACYRHLHFPAYIPLGLIAQESAWNPGARNGDAVGLMQVRPSSAMAHFRALGVAFTSEALRDPVMNVTIGLRILFDCQDAAVAMGWSPMGQYTRGLYDYNGGGEAYARKVLAQAVPYQRSLDAPLRDKLQGSSPDPVEPEPVKPGKGGKAGPKPAV